MYEYLKGIVVQKLDNYLVLDNTGVGYRIYMTRKDLVNIQKDQELKIYVYYYIKDDERQLYGFVESYDKEVFELLISVSGVGVKMAIRVFDQISASQIVQNIYEENIIELKKVKGLGEKVVKKIFLELKSKIVPYIDKIVYNKKDNSTRVLIDELRNVLISLGYKENIIVRVIDEMEIGENSVLEELVKTALGRLNKF